MYVRLHQDALDIGLNNVRVSNTFPVLTWYD